MTSFKKTRWTLAIVALLAIAAQRAPAVETVAGAGCGCAKRSCLDCNPCKTCRGRFECGKVCDKACKAVAATKTVTVTCWETVCKTICLAGRSCGCQGTCGNVRTVKRLIRKTYTKEVPITRCEVTNAPPCSCGSAARCGCGTPASADEVPAAPKPTARGPHLNGRYTLSNQEFRQSIG